MLRLTASRHFLPIVFLIALALLYWGSVLFMGQVLLPGAMLKGFAPFGSDPQALWNILQWDALAQYYPWRVFAARQLQGGVLPLWNPHQFSGAPFLANGQSAVFYPLHFPFWLSFGKFDVAWAFGFSAFLHTLLASLSTYALLQRWKSSRAAAVLGAVAFGFCGYFASWIMLPTLANTAAWLPLCLLLLERAVVRKTASDKTAKENRFRLVAAIALALALACALLAGHAQVFFYIVVALALRSLFLKPARRALSTLLVSGAMSLGLCAIQILPTLELARLGHRAGSKPSLEGWNFLVPRALQISDLPSLFLPVEASYSFSENFGYVGAGVLLLGVIAIIALFTQNSKLKTQNRLAPNCLFALSLAAFGVLYATATPLSQAFYFLVPGLSQMGGVGRALVLWSFGIAVLAAFGLDAVRRKWSTPVLPLVALLLVCGELFANGIGTIPTAPRAAIYPPTQLTQFLQSNSSPDARVLFITPRGSWLPLEMLQSNNHNHPEGVLPPNGAMVFEISDVNGYDSLAPRAYREFLAKGEGADVSPLLNGNMILLSNPHSPALDSLGVRYIVSENALDLPNAKEVLRADGAIVYERARKNIPRRDGKDFSPGWRNGKYQPQSFKLGAFISLLMLSLMAAVLARSGAKRGVLK